MEFRKSKAHKLNELLSPTSFGYTFRTYKQMLLDIDDFLRFGTSQVAQNKSFELFVADVFASHAGSIGKLLAVCI